MAGPQTAIAEGKGGPWWSGAVGWPPGWGLAGPVLTPLPDGGGVLCPVGVRRPGF